MRRMILLFALLFIPANTDVFACSCASFTPCEAFGAFDAIFLGKIVEGSETSGTDFVSGNVSIEVEEVFKGIKLGTISIDVPSMKGTSCGYSGLARGRVYLIHANKGSTGRLITWPCSGNRDSQYAGEELNFLRNLPGAGIGGKLSGIVGLDNGERNPPGLESIKIILEKDKKQYLETKTDINGKYELSGIEPGEYVVEAKLPPHYKTYNVRRDVRIADRGCTTTNYWTKIDGKVTGRVFDINGQPAGVSVWLISAEDKEKPVKKIDFSDSTGRFEITDVPPGTYYLQVKSKQIDDHTEKTTQIFYYPDGRGKERATLINIKLGQQIEGIEFQLPAKHVVKTVTGRILKQDGNPFQGVELFLSRDESKLSGKVVIGRWSSKVVTDEKGFFTIQGFQGEFYKLEAIGLHPIFPDSKNVDWRKPVSFPIELKDDVQGLVLVLTDQILSEKK